MTKRCPKCEQNLDVSKFTKNKARIDGLNVYCKDCMKIHQRGWKRKDMTSDQKWRNHLTRYNLSPEEFNEMRQAQRGLCAICLFPHAELVVDHCHETGRVRGLLCHKCNVGIGMFRDDPEVLQSAITYLEKSPSPTFVNEGD